MRWLKKWAYLILFLGTGLGYFACVDHWQVYAESVNRLKGWYEELRGEDSSTIPTGAENMLPEYNGETERTSAEDRNENGEPGESFTDDGTGIGDAAGENKETGTEQGNAEGQADGQEDERAEGPADEQGNEGADGSADGRENEEAEGSADDPVYMTVEDDYFSDALFIGDSRTVGMFEYGGLEEVATFYASKGLTVYKLFDSQIVPTPGGKITVEEGLQQNSFSKIYLMIGINEMGTGTVETFLEKYREVVEHLQELQPDALIYLQAIIKVTTERSEKGDYINNEGIEARNEGIALLADNEKIFYLDVNPLICDETGGMTPSYTFDGVHLMAKYIEVWKEYLKTHAISP